MKLYSYFRSSAAYRVRIALNFKNIAHQMAYVNLLKSEQLAQPYLNKNAQGLLPALENEHGVLAQSLAILEWLEECYPHPALLPGNAWQKAQIRNLCYAVACDIHPLNNLRVLKYLSQELVVSEQQKNHWYQHWIYQGFEKVERLLTGNPLYCMGNEVTLADVCLIPQVFNALRFNIDMAAFPKIAAIYQHCNTHPAFIAAAPQNQADAV